jgi:hypothetical protein
MDGLFGGKGVEIDDVDQGRVEFYLEPFLVSDLPELIRIQGIMEDDEYLGAWLMKEMLADKMDIQIGPDWSFELLGEVFRICNELNFGKPKPGRTKDSVKKPEDLMGSFEFLISQGHDEARMPGYTVPFFLAALEAAIDRVYGKAEDGGQKSEVGGRKPGRSAIKVEDFFGSAGISVTQKTTTSL